MNSLKIVIPIFVAITIVIIIFNLTQNEVSEERVLELKNSSEINKLMDKIKMDKIKNDELENPFIPKEREWITSGPFKIDRSEYLLGEKIFVNIDELLINEKGKVVFLRPINSTHYSSYHNMIFDGTGQRNNYYFTPDLSIISGICNTDDLIGNWKVVFQGTEYSDLKFKVTEEIIPGNEKRYESVC
tara:strand:+ start:34 stop:594 length:561 start_codon:yes stop_codon:yes gene_type:complete